MYFYTSTNTTTLGTSRPIGGIVQVTSKGFCNQDCVFSQKYHKSDLLPSQIWPVNSTSGTSTVASTSGTFASRVTYFICSLKAIAFAFSPSDSYNLVKSKSCRSMLQFLIFCWKWIGWHHSQGLECIQSCPSWVHFDSYWIQLVLPLCLTEENNSYNMVCQVQYALFLFPDGFSPFSFLFCITVILSLFKAVGINQIHCFSQKICFIHFSIWWRIIVT